MHTNVLQYIWVRNVLAHQCFQKCLEGASKSLLFLSKCVYFSSWKAAALEAAWHHICSASTGVVSRIKSLSPASLMLRSVKKQCGKKKAPKKKKKKKSTENFCPWIQKSPLHARFIYIKLVMTFQVSLRLKCLLDHLKLLSWAPATLLTWRAGLLRV